MTTLRELNYMIEANTDGLNKAFPALNKLVGTLHELDQSVNKLTKGIEDQFGKIGKASQAPARQFGAGADKIKAALKRQEAALISARNRVLDLNKAIKDSGGDSRLLANNTRAFNVLEKQLKQTGLSAADATLAKAKFTSALATSRRELAAFNAAQRQTVSTQKASDSALIRQTNTIERMRIKVLDLENSLRLQGADAGRIEELNRSFTDFEQKLGAGVLSAKEFSDANNAMAASLAKVRRNEGITDLSTKMTDLAKSAQVALGPLSGVASRITAITSLANRNNVVIAGVIGGMIAFGTSMARAVKMGAQFEQQTLRIDAVLAATGNRVGMNGGQIEEAVRRVAGATMATETQVRDAAASLLTFRRVGKEVYESALMAAQGLALIARGDINSQIRNIGRILEDPINNLNTLTESGVVFNAVEREKIKNLQESGDLLGAQQAVMERVNIVTEAATGEARGLLGQWKLLTDTFNNFLSDAAVNGGAVASLTSILADLNRRIKEFSGNTAIGAGLMKGYKVAADVLGGALVFLVTHLDKVILAFSILLAMRVATMFLNAGKAMFIAAAGARALLLNVIPIGRAFKLVSVGIAAVTGWQLLEWFEDSGFGIDELVGKLDALNNAFEEVGGGADEHGKRFQDALKRVTEQLHQKALDPNLDIGFDSSVVDKALEMVNRGNVKEAAEYLERFVGASRRTTQAASDLAKRLEYLQESWVNLRDQHLGFMGELASQRNQLQHLENDWDDMVKALTDFGMTAEQAEASLRLLRTQIETSGSSTSQFTTGLERSIETMKRDLNISKATGAEKRRLQLEQNILNQLWASGITNASNYQQALEDLRTAGFGGLIDEISKLTAEMERLDYLQTVQGMNKELSDSLELMRAEVALAGKSEYERAVGLEIARQKQLMLNAGISEGTEEYNHMLAVVRQLADLDFQKQHIEAMKSLQEQAKAQDRNLSTMFYSQKTRERMIALQEKENELLLRYGSLLDERAQKELQLFKTLQKRDEIIADWQEVANAIESAFKGLEDAIVDFVKTGEFNFAKFASAILEDIFRITLRATILNPLQDWLGGLMGNVSKTPIGEAWQGGAMPGVGQFLGGVGTVANPAYVIPMGPGLGGAGAGGIGEGWGLRGTFGPEGAGAGGVGGMGSGMGGWPVDHDITRSPLPPVPGYGANGFPLGQSDQSGLDQLYQQSQQLNTSFENLNTTVPDVTSQLRGSFDDMSRSANDLSNNGLSRATSGMERLADDTINRSVEAQVTAATSTEHMGSSSTTTAAQVDQLGQAASSAAASLQGAGGIPGLGGAGGGGGSQMAALQYINQAATRNQKLTASLEKKIQEAVGAVYGPGATAQVYSGGQHGIGSGLARIGSTRHDFGKAADIYVRDAMGNKMTGEQLTPLVQEWQRRGFGGTGVEMRGGGIHLDEHADRARYWDYGNSSQSLSAANRRAATLGQQGQMPQSMMGQQLPQQGPIPGMKPEGFDKLNSSVDSLNGKFEELGSSVGDASNQLTNSFENTTKQADELSNQGLNKVANSMDQVDQTVTGSIQSQAQAAAQTEQMGTSSTTTSAQIEQLGQAAMNAAASMQAQGSGMPGVPGLSGGVPGTTVGLGTGLGGGPAAFGPTGAGIADPMGMMGPGSQLLNPQMLGGQAMGMMGGMPGMGMGGMGGMPGMGMMGGMGGMGGGMSSFQSFGGGTMGGMGGGMAGGMGGGDVAGLGQLSQSVQQANNSFMQMNEQLPEISSTLTSGLERVTDSAQELADNGLNRVSSGMERVADDAITKTVTSQAQTAATTQKLGTDSMLTSAQIQQLGQAAMQASMQMSMGGIGGMFFHSGGIVGSNGAPAFVGGSWGGAPRLHGGLHPDEFRAVLKRGEGVFTEEQMEALGNAINSRGEAEGEGGGGYSQRGRSNQFQVVLQGVKDYDSFKRSESQLQAGLSRAYQKASSAQG